MDKFAIQCPQCKGNGIVRVQPQTNKLRYGAPGYEELPCGECDGTGQGQRVAVYDLQRYLSEPPNAPEDLFALARTVASRLRLPKTKKKPPQNQSWILSTKTGVRTDSVQRYDSSFYEVEREETVLVLMDVGSFGKAKRTQMEIGWNPGSEPEEEEIGWSDWEAQPISDIDELLVEFDLKGTYDVENPGLWGRKSSVLGDMDSILAAGLDLKLNLRQIYPKGVGLYLALKALESGR